MLTTDYPTGREISRGAGGGKNDGFVPSSLRIGDTPQDGLLRVPRSLAGPQDLKKSLHLASLLMAHDAIFPDILGSKSHEDQQQH